MFLKAIRDSNVFVIQQKAFFLKKKEKRKIGQNCDKLNGFFKNCSFQLNDYGTLPFCGFFSDLVLIFFSSPSSSQSLLNSMHLAPSSIQPSLVLLDDVGGSLFHRHRD